MLFYRSLLCICLVACLSTYSIGQVSPASRWSFRGGGGAEVRGTQGVANAANTPGPRLPSSAVTFADAANDKLYVYADAALWVFDAATEQWTWLHGPEGTVVQPNYGSFNQGTALTHPGSRYEAAGWFDAERQGLWLYGGVTSASNYRCDMWYYSLATNQWTWVAGDTLVNKPGYATDPFIDDSRPTPGVVSQTATWYVNNNIHPEQSSNPTTNLGGMPGGKLYLFGGLMSDFGDQNRMWCFSTADKKWYLADKNSQVINSGTIQLRPNIRRGAAAWQQAELFSDPPETVNLPGYTASRDALFVGGGYGLGGDGTRGGLNDIWKYDVLTNSYTHVSGPKQATNYWQTTGNNPYLFGLASSTQSTVGTEKYAVSLTSEEAVQVWRTNAINGGQWQKLVETTGSAERPRFEHSTLVKPNPSSGRVAWVAKNRLYVFVQGRVFSFFDPCPDSPNIAVPTTQVAPGESRTFTATATGSNLSYQWRRNGFDIAGATNPTYTSSTIRHNDKFTCAVQKNAPCLNGLPLQQISNEITMTGPLPANDDVCNATELQLNAAPSCVDNRYATIAANEPKICGSTAAVNTVWYKYTPTKTEAVLITLGGAHPTENPAAQLGIFVPIGGTCETTLQLSDSTILLGSCSGQNFLPYAGNAGPSSKSLVQMYAGKTYYIRIRATENGWFGTLCLALASAPPPLTDCAAPLYPLTGNDSVPGLHALRWSAVPGATQYEVWLSGPQANAPFVRVSTRFNLDYTVSAQPLATYRWYVRPQQFGVPSVGDCASNAQTFRMAAPAAHDLPAGAATLTKNGPPACLNNTYAYATGEQVSGVFCAGTSARNTIWWKYSPTITERVQLNVTRVEDAVLLGRLGIFIDTNTDGILEDSTQSVFGTTPDCPNVFTDVNTRHDLLLRAGVTYFFRVAALGAAGTACLSITNAEIPLTECVTLIHPQDGAVGVTSTTLVWRKVSNASRYEVRYAPGNSPNNILGTTMDTTITLMLPPQFSSRWWVVPLKAGGSSPPFTSCSSISFTTAAAPTNDLVCNALPLVLDSENDACGDNSLATSTDDVGVPCFITKNTVWYMYTPTTATDYILSLGTTNDALGGNFAISAFVPEWGSCATGNLQLYDSTIALFRTCRFVLNSVGRANTPTQWRARLQAGTTYYFRVSTFTSNDNHGKFCLGLRSANVHSVKNGDWNDPSTWSNGKVPVPHSSVTVTHQITLGASTTCHALTIANGANVIVAPGVTIDVSTKN